ESAIPVDVRDGHRDIAQPGRVVRPRRKRSVAVAEEHGDVARERVVRDHEIRLAVAIEIADRDALGRSLSQPRAVVRRDLVRNGWPEERIPGGGAGRSASGSITSAVATSR